ncbi:hypothetical protein ACLB2K_055576 [Fragaria x ananassa]
MIKMYNLYKLSQVALPGEKFLHDTKFLMEKQASNELLDKWIIMKVLPREVGYALVFHGMQVYFDSRLKSISNNMVVEMTCGSARILTLGFNNCQALLLNEWDKLQKWYGEWKFGDYGFSKKSLLITYFVDTSTNERLLMGKDDLLSQDD